MHLAFQPADKLFHVCARVESEAVHTRIELHVYRIIGYTLLFRRLDQCVEQPERIDLRLQPVVEHRLEGRHLGIHYHYVRRDSILSQRYALIGNSHSEIVHAMILQRLCNLHRTRSVSVGLYHADEFRVGFHHRAIVIKIRYHRVEIHFERCLVYLLYEKLRQTVETKLRAPFISITSSCKPANNLLSTSSRQSLKKYASQPAKRSF